MVGDQFPLFVSQGTDRRVDDPIGAMSGDVLLGHGDHGKYRIFNWTQIGSVFHKRHDIIFFP